VTGIAATRISKSSTRSRRLPACWANICMTPCRARPSTGTRDGFGRSALVIHGNHGSV